MRIYYDLIIWEEIDQYDIEKLQNRVQEFGKRLNGFGILSFNMRATPPQGQQLTQEQQEQYEQAEDQQQEDLQEEQEEQPQIEEGQEVVDE